LYQNISHVLTVAHNLPPVFPDNFKYKNIAIYDFPHYDISKHFKEGISFIREGVVKGKGVLVHCQMGISRSVTMILAYLMTYEGLSYSNALKNVKE
jgi:protein-tyrosine phosphatase